MFEDAARARIESALATRTRARSRAPGEVLRISVGDESGFLPPTGVGRRIWLQKASHSRRRVEHFTRGRLGSLARPRN
eukprot:7573563-Lingulodinium_polyedra.AAC.1